MLLLRSWWELWSVVSSAPRRARLTYGVSADGDRFASGAVTIHFSTAPERLKEGLVALMKRWSASSSRDRRQQKSIERAATQRALGATGQTAMSRCQEIVLDVVYGLGLGRSESLDKALDAVEPEKV